MSWNPEYILSIRPRLSIECILITSHDQYRRLRLLVQGLKPAKLDCAVDMSDKCLGSSREQWKRIGDSRGQVKIFSKRCLTSLAAVTETMTHSQRKYLNDLPRVHQFSVSTATIRQKNSTSQVTALTFLLKYLVPHSKERYEKRNDQLRKQTT